VSATTSLDTIASFSSRGNYIDISAPGQSIWTTNRGGTYGMWYGTSLASPVVAGVVALMMGANPGLTPATTETLLKANADNLGTAGWDQIYGYGRVNAYRAVAAAAAAATATATTTTASADTTSPTAAITSPASGATVSGLRTVSIAASDNVGVSRVELYVDGALYGSDTTAAYSVNWDTTKVANGTHSLVAKAYDAAGSQGVSASVTVNVSNTDTTPPVTQITSVWTSNRDLKASVAASDNVGVVTVQFYVDAVLYGTSSSTPTTFSVRLKALSAGTHTLRSKAYDAAGNVGTSSGVTFTK
jgi:hypothetical protein